MKSAVENAKRFAMFDAPLLIQGETGVEKRFVSESLPLSEFASR